MSAGRLQDFERHLAVLGFSPDDHISICHSKDFRSEVVRVADAPQVAAAYAGEDCWYGTHSVRPGVRGRGTAADVVGARSVIADLDYDKIGGPETAAAVVAVLSDRLGSLPTSIVKSGHGEHPYWAVERSAETSWAPEDSTAQAAWKGLLERWGALVQEVARGYGGMVDDVFEPARVLRTPGTVNRKDEDAPRPVTVQFPGGSPVSVSTLDEVCPPLPLRRNTPEDTATPEQPVADTPEYDALTPEMRQRVDAYVNSTVKGIQDELRAAQDWPPGYRDEHGDGWDMRSAKRALRIASLCLAGWNRLAPSEGHAAFMAAAPTDDSFTPRELEAKWSHKVRTATPAPWPAALDGDAPITVETVAEWGQPTTGTSAEAVSLDTCHATFGHWLGGDYDLQALGIVLAAAAVERLDGDPVWVLVVSGSGAAKTETVTPLAGAGATVTSTITSEGALLSATSKKETAKDATGGLLRKIGSRGVLVIKDFTSILSMNRDVRATVLAALREVYDGTWERNVGTDGGRTLTWAGRLVVIGAVTTAIDSAHAVMASMGERFVLVRIDSRLGRLTSGRQALSNVGHEAQMRSELSTVVGQVLQGIQPAAATLDQDDEEALLAFADIVTLARTAVERDSRGEVVDAHAPEMPTRFAKMIGQLVRGGLALGMSRQDARALAARAARDSVPPLRLAILADVAEHPLSTTSEVTRRLQKPRTTVDRCLQELHVLSLLNALDGLPGRPGWRYDLAPAVDRRTLADLVPRNVTTPGFREVKAVPLAADIPGDASQPDWRAASHCPVCGHALRHGACPLCTLFDSGELLDYSPSTEAAS